MFEILDDNDGVPFKKEFATRFKVVKKIFLWSIFD